MPAAPQLGTRPALHAFAFLASLQPVLRLPPVFFLIEGAAMQQVEAPGVQSAHTASQIGAPVVQGAQLVPQVGAPPALGAQFANGGVHTAVCTQFAFCKKVPFAVYAPPLLQVGAPLAMGAQLALLVGAQFAELAADWDERAANTFLKL